MTVNQVITFISLTDTAKIIRQELKNHFPRTKFSVQSNNSSIRIYWTDGYSKEEVSSKIDFFKGASYDSSRDLHISRNVEYKGKRVNFGADFIFYHRENTKKLNDAEYSQLLSNGYSQAEIEILMNNGELDF